MSITPSPRIGIIVVEGGSGTRLGAGAPKAFVGIDEHSMLRHALRGVLAAGPAQVVIVAPAGREGDALTEALAASEEAPALDSGRRRDLISVVTGGETRQGSVAAGLGALWADVEVVLVHDAARALTPPAVFERVVETVRRTGSGVVPTLPVIDTIKRVDGGGVDGAAVLEAVFRVVPGRPEPPLTRYTLSTIAYSQTLDLTRAKAELGDRLLVSLDEALARAAADQRAHA